MSGRHWRRDVACFLSTHGARACVCACVFVQCVRTSQSSVLLTPLRKSVCVCVCMFMRVWLVLRVKRREITREGGHFHSCKSMLNTSLPLEQLPYPKQLYGRVGSAQVNSDVGQLPGTGASSEPWTPARESPVRAGPRPDLQGQSLIPHLGSNYLCL